MFEVRLAKHFPKLSKDIKLEIQEPLHTPEMVNTKITTPDRIVKPKHKEKLLKSSQRKETTHYL